MQAKYKNTVQYWWYIVTQIYTNLESYDLEVYKHDLSDVLFSMHTQNG
jgi:hypothetical protein